MRRLKPIQKRRQGDFRLIRCLGVDLNVLRLKRHFKRLERRMHADHSYRRIKLKVRRRQRAELASIAV